jgi:simple sugar transport system ATP-binding protein
MNEPNKINGNILSLSGISKSFGGVKAIRGIDFHVEHNEIVALIGDNGAGKSTLIKVITGVNKPNAGEIYFKGKRITRHSVKTSRDLGIETVYQEKALSDLQALWRNIFMGRELTTFGGFLKIREQKKHAERLLRDEMGFTSSVITVNSPVKGLSGGEKQGVAIGRALFFNAELIILDEPTVGLSISETAKVLDFIKDVKKRGKSVIFISHNIHHVYDVADRFVILDRGQVAKSYRKENISSDELSDRMVKLARTGRVE